MWGSRGTPGIVVNERGERFVDESWGRHGISHVMAKETRSTFDSSWSSINPSMKRAGRFSTAFRDSG